MSEPDFEKWIFNPSKPMRSARRLKSGSGQIVGTYSPEETGTLTLFDENGKKLFSVPCVAVDETDHPDIEIEIDADEPIIVEAK